MWFSLGTPVPSTNKTDRHDITEILLKSGIKHHTSNHNPPYPIRREHLFEVDLTLGQFEYIFFHLRRPLPPKATSLIRQDIG
jgi:hypothetical protein